MSGGPAYKKAEGMKGYAKAYHIVLKSPEDDP